MSALNEERTLGFNAFFEKGWLIMPDKKMFRINEDGVSEWVVDESREQSFESYRELVENEHDESVFIDFYNRDSNEKNLNILIIGKSGPGKVFCLKHRL